MPIFEFRCLNCGKVFEKLFLSQDKDQDANLICPQCQGEALERVISRANSRITPGSSRNPKITSKACSSGNNCMTLEVPGYGD